MTCPTLALLQCWGVLGGRWEACKEMAFGETRGCVCTAAPTHRCALNFVPAWVASPKKSSVLMPMKWGAGSMSSLGRTGPSALCKGPDSATVTPGDGRWIHVWHLPSCAHMRLRKAATLKIREKRDVGDRRFSLELQVSSLAILVPFKDNITNFSQLKRKLFI